MILKSASEKTWHSFQIFDLFFLFPKAKLRREIKILKYVLLLRFLKCFLLVVDTFF